METEMIGKLKIVSDRRLEKLNRKANKTYSLNKCPKCDKEVYHTGYNYIGECFESYSRCKNCNLLITHYFDWKESEIGVYDRGDK